MFACMPEEGQDVLLSTTAQGGQQQAQNMFSAMKSVWKQLELTRTLADALVAEMLRILEVTTGTGAATKAASDNRAELRRPLIVVLGDTRAAADSIEAKDSMAARLLGGGGEGSGNAWQTAITVGVCCTTLLLLTCGQDRRLGWCYS